MLLRGDHMKIKKWFKENYWVGERPVAIKSLLYTFLFVALWSILNSYDWEITKVMKYAFTIWFVGSLSYLMARKTEEEKQKKSE
jgi:hypothetical protein